MSCALAGFATGAGGTIEIGALGLPAGAAGFLGGIGFADTLGSVAITGAGPFGALDAEGPEPAAKASLSRRATGASTVLDADLTNSPISLSLARTFLLSTPSSFASSCTRALPGTALLTSRSCEPHPQRPHSCTRSLVISGTSSCAHVGRPTLLVRVGPGGSTVGGSGRL